DGRGPRGRRQWRTPWRRPAQGVRRRGGTADVRVVAGGAGGGGDRPRRRHAAGRLRDAGRRPWGRDALGVRAGRARGGGARRPCRRPRRGAAAGLTRALHPLPRRARHRG
ncbi:MAG: 2-C-methyl-D-erythritol 4-phosphate cytidylyltransferase, partial [uncultured Rubrobacteraceae bacterium]